MATSQAGIFYICSELKSGRHHGLQLIQAGNCNITQFKKLYQMYLTQTVHYWYHIQTICQFLTQRGFQIGSGQGWTSLIIPVSYTKIAGPMNSFNMKYATGYCTNMELFITFLGKSAISNTVAMALSVSGCVCVLQALAQVIS